MDSAKEKEIALVRRLRLKRALLEAGDPRHEEIRTLLLISGGGMRGVYGAGVCLALQHLGLGDCFDVVLGVSAGAPIGAYFLAGKEQAKLGTTIYYEECLSGFIRYSFPLPTLHVDLFAEVLSIGKKRLDLDAFFGHRSKFFVGVTKWKNGESALIDAKHALPNPIAAIMASLALTFAYPLPIIVNGEKCTDGGMSLPLPLKKAVGMFAPTDVLVVSNYSEKMSREMGDSLAEKIMDVLALARLPRSLVHSFHRRDASWKENIASAERSSLNTAILYGAHDVELLTKDLAKLRAATEKGIRDTFILFGDAITPPKSLMP